MSGFQIPGLGQAKPNETLPPLLPSDVDVAAAAPSEPDAQMQDANQPPAEPAAEPAASEKKEEEANPSEGDHAPQDQPATEDAMAVDQPKSPPSLTHALEAAIGGLESSTTTQQLQTEPQTQEAAPPAEPPNGQGENPEWEIDSSPYESSSESSSSDSSGEDSDNEGYELLGVEETARLLMETEGGSDDEGARGGAATTANQMRTKNEMPEETIPRPDVTITPEMKIEELGTAEHIVENIMLIKAITPGEYQVLDAGSVLCNADRAVIGVVAETIGKVLQPMYTVRFNSQDEIKELGIALGTKIFYPVDHASYVFTEPLKSIKGSDASNIHDEEVGDDEMEFSDDEKEAEYKRALKQKKRNRHAAAGDGGRGGRGPHPLRQEMAPDGGLNYDDDGPYKPLTRPPGYGTGAASGEPVELPPRPNFQRGGRRGDHRGRGGRGRGSGRGGGRGGYSQPRDGYSLPPQGHQPHPQQHQQHQHQTQHQHQPQPSGPWNTNAAPPPPPQAAAPAMPSFGFQFPGWPQQPPQGHGVPALPPPPPGWPAQGAQAQAQASGAGAFVNPALIAALMNQMQAQNGQQQWGGQQQQPPPQ